MPLPVPISAAEARKYQLEASLRYLKFQPPCPCDNCFRQYRSPDLLGQLFNYEGHMNPEEVKYFVWSHTKSVNESRLFIHAALSLHGDSILKKWRRDRNTREKLLKRVQPDISLFGTPIIHLSMHGNASLEDRPKLRQMLLLPYLSLDSLVEDASKMIGLLYHRATESSAAWMAFDNIELQEGWRFGTITEKSAHGSIKLYGTEYGILQPFNAVEVHQGISYGTPRALLILDAQRILLDFLRRIVCMILDDESKAREILNQQTLSKLTLDSKLARFLAGRQTRLSARPVFGRIYTEQPFMSAPRYDLDELISIANDRVAEKEDELWLLQTDLDHVFEQVKYHERNWFDHGQMGIPGVTAEDKANNIGYMTTVRAAIHTRNWRWILEECQNRKREALAAGISDISKGDLPTRYEKALGYLSLLLEPELQDVQRSLERTMWKSPAFQSHFAFKIIQKEDLPPGCMLEEIPLWQRMRIAVRDPAKLYFKDRLAWCLYLLTVEPRVEPGMPPNANNLGNDHHIILQHLDSYLASQPFKESQRIDSELYRVLTDLTAVERMKDLLEFHRPKFHKLEPTDMPERRKAWSCQNIDV